MESFNQRAIQAFGQEHAEMHPDSPNVYFDERIGRLNTYLDMDIVRRWAIPALPPQRIGDLRILDVGAGKGRMTRQFARLAKRCVAIEPFPDFYNALTSGPLAVNIETYSCTFFEFAQTCRERFDIIYVGGVTPYMDDQELAAFFYSARRFLRAGGVVVSRELASRHRVARQDGQFVIARTPVELVEAARVQGLSLVRTRRAYPVNIPWLAFKSWPNRLTSVIWQIASHRITYPIWKLLGMLNVSPGTDSFVVYMFRDGHESRTSDVPESGTIFGGRPSR